MIKLNKKTKSLLLLPFFIFSQSVLAENTHKQIFANYINKTYKINKSEAIHIVDEVYHNSKKHKIEPTLLLGMIENESSFNKHKRNKSTATGLMQVVPKWHQDKIKKVINNNGGNLTTVKNNIEIGTIILKNEMNKYSNMRRALQAYNGAHKSTKYSNSVFRSQNKFKQMLIGL